MTRFLTFLLVAIIFIPVVRSQSIEWEEIDSKNISSVIDHVDSLYDQGEYNNSLTGYYAIRGYLTEIAKKSKKTYLRLAQNSFRISRIYLFSNDTLSTSYAQKAIDYSLKSSDSVYIEKCYSLKYYCLYEYPGAASELNRLADKCIDYSEKLNIPELMGEAYMHKFNALVELGKFDEGDVYCKKAEETFKTIEGGTYLASVYNNIGNVFIKVKRYDKALSYHQKGYDLELALNNLDGFVESSYQLANTYFLLGKHKESNEMYRLHLDSLTVKNNNLLSEKFTASEAKFNSAQKERDIAKKDLQIVNEARSKNQVVFISIIALLVVVMFYQLFLYRQRKKKRKTELALVQEQKMNELRTNFLENIAHEIRTPITLINGNLQLALEDDTLSMEVSNFINSALSNSRRVLIDSNEILDLLRFEKGKLPLQSNEIKLQEFLKRVFYSFDSLAAIKNIKLNYNSNFESAINIKSDESRFEKILNNLISNAIKFSPVNVEIKMDVDLSDGLLTIELIDQGQGIEASELDKIFTRFYQSKHTESIGGVGVGLSLAKEFAESLDGEITAASVIGEGSTFKLSIPVKSMENVVDDLLQLKNEDDQFTEEIEVNTSFMQDGKPRVLIVEDNPEMNNYLSLILSANYHCQSCFDGLEALKEIQINRYDLIISDIMMPNIDGFEFRTKVRSLDKYKLTPFIFVTAKILMEDKLKGFELGVDDYITKPFEKPELLARVAIILSNKTSREKWIKDGLEFLDNSGDGVDEQLLTKIRLTVMDNLSDENFKVPELAQEVNYSQRQLARILNKHTGLSPVKFILEVRLQSAYRLLIENQFATLSEVRHAVGLISGSYFNKKYKERFGKSPAEMMNN